MKDTQGYIRGKCGLCECSEYCLPKEGNACDYCDHKPVVHALIADSTESKIKDAQSAESPSGQSATKNKSHELDYNPSFYALRIPTKVFRDSVTPLEAASPISSQQSPSPDRPSADVTSPPSAAAALFERTVALPQVDETPPLPREHSDARSRLLCVRPITTTRGGPRIDSCPTCCTARARTRRRCTRHALTRRCLRPRSPRGRRRRPGPARARPARPLLTSASRLSFCVSVAANDVVCGQVGAGTVAAHRVPLAARSAPQHVAGRVGVQPALAATNSSSRRRSPCRAEPQSHSHGHSHCLTRPRSRRSIQIAFRSAWRDRLQTARRGVAV